MSPVRTGGRGRRAHSSFFADWSREQPADTAPVVLSERELRPARRVVRTVKRRGVAAGAVAALAAGGAAVVLTASTASADPSASDWSRLRQCESSNNYSINTGNGYYGAYQFDLGTWQSVGGHGYPNQASPGEQDARALILYRLRGWQPWTCARILGLKEDKDARSGRISDIHVPGSGGGGGGGGTTTGGAPAYPSSQSYSYGDTSSTIKAFQDQMHKRGAIPAGTGYYGDLTKAVVVRLQQLNGINASGLLGPLTWRAAFVGKWSAAGSTTPSAPAYPSKYVFSIGADNHVVADFQKQMNKRGATQLQGTGQFGPLTKAVVVRLQQLNHFRVVSGQLGPNTWKAAFVGAWSNS